MTMQRLTAITLHISLLFLTLPLLAHASLPQSSSVPGGVAIIQLGSIAQISNKPKAWFQDQAVLVSSDNKKWVAVVGLPLNLKPGTQQLRISKAGKTTTQAFRVKPKKYLEQHITLKDTGKVELSTENEERAVREIATIKELKRNWSENDSTDLDFIIPAEGRLSGNFGLRRFFNGKPRSPHAGLDVAVARGTPIKASAPGKVLAVDDYFFNGKTVFLDHGNGLITMYCHLDQSEVKTGDMVSKGQPIALSGQSGRATGPHLHWSVILNGAMVDPALFIRSSIQDNAKL